VYFGLNGTIINVYVSIIYFSIHLSSHSTCKRDNKEKEYIFMEKDGINFRISLPAIFSYAVHNYNTTRNWFRDKEYIH
jgi:hypothetical protein